VYRSFDKINKAVQPWLYMGMNVLVEQFRWSIVTEVSLLFQVRCLNCSSESKKHDPFLDLSLDIPEKFQLPRKTKDSEDMPPPCSIAG
jgi:ubiquitin carboxyl-terminal hydrolase 3